MKYNFCNWNVELIQRPEELRNKLESLNIKGKKITDVKLIGGFFSSLVDKEKNHYWMDIDRPILIYFEDGKRLEMDYSDASTIKVGVDSLPQDIEVETELKNMFKQLIGRRIVDIEVISSKQMPDDFTGSYGVTLDEKQDSYIDQINFILDSNYYLEFRTEYDYGLINLVRIEDRVDMKIELESSK